MRNFEYSCRKRYLAAVIPSLFLTACNVGSTTTSSSTSPYIQFSTIGLIRESMALGESFTVVATLNANGNTVPATTIVPVSLTTASGQSSFESFSFSPPSCSISSQAGNESCVINISISADANPESYVLTMQDFPAITVYGEQIPFTIKHLRIFVTESANNGNFLTVAGAVSGFDGADKFCLKDSNNPDGAGNGKWKALLFGNSSTQTGALYSRTDMLTPIAYATGGNLTGSNSTLINSIGTSASPIRAWTGPGINTCSDWESGANNQGMAGNPAAATAKWANFGNESCNTGRVLYCVEQDT